jgi:hypothetical protein
MLNLSDGIPALLSISGLLMKTKQPVMPANKVVLDWKKSAGAL